MQRHKHRMPDWRYVALSCWWRCDKQPFPGVGVGLDGMGVGDPFPHPPSPDETTMSDGYFSFWHGGELLPANGCLWRTLGLSRKWQPYPPRRQSSQSRTGARQTTVFLVFSFFSREAIASAASHTLYLKNRDGLWWGLPACWGRQ